MIKIITTLTILLLLSGCIIYGEGETIGYIYAVDDGIFWDKVWYKSNLESSESDCYLLSTTDDELKDTLRQISGNTKVKLRYRRHLMTVASCPSGTETDDEITSIEPMEE